MASLATAAPNEFSTEALFALAPPVPFILCKIAIALLSLAIVTDHSLYQVDEPVDREG